MIGLLVGFAIGCSWALGACLTISGTAWTGPLWMPFLGWPVILVVNHFEAKALRREQERKPS